MRRVGILTVSDSCFTRKRQDESGSAARSIMEKAGFKIEYYCVVPDERRHITKELKYIADKLELDLILTTGGTGFSQRDITPEATQEVLERIIPGIPEAFRTKMSEARPFAILSRAIAGIRKKTLIVNLPGSTDGVRECLKILVPLLTHAFEMIEGKGHNAQRK